MKVGLVAVDGRIANHALMKLATHHRSLGDQVEWAFPLAAHTYDRVYRSKIFTTSVDDPIEWPCEVIEGGTGYGLDSRLPCGDDVMPAYDLYPACDYALGRITRGCVRRCEWCVVWRQDGNRVRQVAELDDFLAGRQRVRLLDDNLTALPDLFIATCDELAARRVECYFEALDIRLMSVEMARSLARVRLWGKTVGRAHFAWDALGDEEAVRAGIAALKAGGFPLYAATFYVLIGAGTTHEEDLYRVRLLDELGVDSYAMCFDKADPYQVAFARWVNMKPAFRSTDFAHYDVNARRPKRNTVTQEAFDV